MRVYERYLRFYSKHTYTRNHSMNTWGTLTRCEMMLTADLFSNLGEM